MEQDNSFFLFCTLVTAILLIFTIISFVRFSIISMLKFLLVLKSPYTVIIELLYFIFILLRVYIMILIFSLWLSLCSILLSLSVFFLDFWFVLLSYMDLCLYIISEFNLSLILFTLLGVLRMLFEIFHNSGQSMLVY